MSPYIEQAAERARLPVLVAYDPDHTEYHGGWAAEYFPEIWFVIASGDYDYEIYNTAGEATRAYVQLRSKLEDGQ